MRYAPLRHFCASARALRHSSRNVYDSGPPPPSAMFRPGGMSSLRTWSAVPDAFVVGALVAAVLATADPTGAPFCWPPVLGDAPPVVQLARASAENASARAPTRLLGLPFLERPPVLDPSRSRTFWSSIVSLLAAEY